jgi:hypothetical protein
VLAVGQHDDRELRRRAIEAGAAKVFAYRRLADDGAAVLGLWLTSAGEPDILRHADPAREAPAARSAALRPTIPPERYAERMAVARALAEEGGITALLIGVGADLRYLTGYVALPLERLTMLVLPATGRGSLVVPRLEALPARGSAAASAGLVDVLAWDETDDPVALVAGLVGDAAGPAREPLLVAVSDRLWAAFVLALQAALPDAELARLGSARDSSAQAHGRDEIALLRMAAGPPIRADRGGPGSSARAARAR